MSDENFYEYDSICKSLDKLAIAILNTLQDIILERQYLDANLKEGCIDMAKSRYLMRGQKVSILQVNRNNLFATRKVLSSSDVVGSTEYLNYSVSGSSDLDKCKSDLKHRHGAENELAEKMRNASIDKTENVDFKSTKDSGVPASSDPLKWFGLLVPESLRLCQLRFKQAMDTAVKVTSLQNKLKSLGVEYRNLKLKREHFVIKKDHQVPLESSMLIN